MTTKTNYEIMMENMTPERMAELGVKLVNIDNRRLFYMTSSGQLYTMDDYQSALQHEYNWLTYRDEEPSGEPDKNPEPEEVMVEHTVEE